MELSRRVLRCIDAALQRFVWMAQITLALCVIIASYYLSDRRPPFAVLDVLPAAARPGQTVTIVAHVWRDLDRECSATFSRYAFDSRHIRFDLAAGQGGEWSFASHQMIDAIQAATPNVLRISFQVPEGMSPGPAILQTELRYACNQMHRIWPIELTTRLPFTVLE